MRYLLFFLILILTATITGNQMEKSRIVPEPQKVSFNDNSYIIPESVTIGLNGASSKLEYAARELSATLEKYLEVTSESEKGNGGDIILSINSGFEGSENIPDTLREESYRLFIENDKISIEAPSAKGVYYGVMSLVQLLEKADNKTLPGMEIVDYPDMSVRGISDDISRGQVSTMENFKRIIDFISRYKMNTYMPYMEDVLELEGFPEIGKDRGALGKEEVKELVDYAEKRFVEVVPIFQTLGHYENILLMEEYLDYAEFPGAASLNVSNEKTYEFLEKMIVQVFEMFPSEYFHMGADESFDVGLGKSAHLVEASNIADVHADHYRKVYDIAKEHGKKVLMYGDIILRHPEILDRLPKDIIIVDWHYRASEEYSSTETFSKAGHKYYVSPSVWNFMTTFPTNINALPNIEYITKAGMKNGASGMINSNWGDYGAETNKELVLFGYAWSAQCAWNIEGSDLGRFSSDYFYDFFGIDDSRTAQLYKTLSNPLDQMMWHDVWRHPLLDFRPPVWWGPNEYFSPVGKIEWMDWTMPQLEKDVEDLRDVVLKNADHLDIISFLADLNDWYKLKMKTVMLLQDALEGKEYNEEKLSGMLDENITRIQELKKKFRVVWLNYYREDNLHMVMDKFDRLVAYFEETKDKLENDKLETPTLDSEWIYYPSGEDNRVTKTEFRREIVLEEKPDSALFQLMGDTWCKLYINGEYVDQVFARRSLSLLVDYGRIKLLDVSSYLKEGKNTIKVIAENYNRRGEAGVNIYGEIYSADKTIQVITDKTWQARPVEEKEWRFAESEDYPYTVTEPNFKTKRTSWIER